MEWLKRLFGGGGGARDEHDHDHGHGHLHDHAHGHGAHGDVHGPGEHARSGEEHPADEQRADPGALAVEGDPRGGLQDEGYRTADPRDVVRGEGVAMSGPGGAPMEGLSAEERRERDETSSG